jgi:FecR protein/SPOR domain
MKRILGFFWLALTVLVAAPACARTLVVEGVVSPAWVERAGKREPLTVGMQLSDKDRIVTGERARVMLRMSEGSAVRLGENATLGLDSLTEKKNAQGEAVVGGSLDVVKGAFRFTTGVFGKPSARREVNVKIATITAGIRGTDVWGRSRTEDDVVCLIEGRITVNHGKQEFVMDEPLQFFIAPRNAPPKPVGRVPQKQIDEWSLDTEITEGQGATRAGGRLRVEVARFADLKAAQDMEARLKAAGYPAVIDAVTGGQHAVCVLGIATARDRDALQARLKAVLAGAPLPASAPAAPAAPKAY